MNENPENMEETKDQTLPSDEVEQGSSQPPEPAEAEKEQDLVARLAEAEKQLEQHKDLLLRKVAEFENYKRRAENEAISIARYGKIDAIQSLLPVVDDFERSLKLSKDTRETEAFARGVELIYQKLMKFLDSQGVKAIESLGKEFDVHYHDALLQVPRNDVPPHMVIEVVEKGYMLDDRVLRHAKVVVSASPPDKTETGTSDVPSDQSNAPSSHKLES
jgi:molecular chaperone GrpE